jgi:hypothetical protein
MLPRFLQLCIGVGLGFFAATTDARPLNGTIPANLEQALERLVHSYPDFISHVDSASLFLKDGRRFPLSDGRTNKSFDQLLEEPDIDDMFFQPYPAGSVPTPPPKYFDPGRVRYEPLFTAMYGDCANTVRSLRDIDWLPKHGGGKIRVTTTNHVDRALEAVSEELDALPDEFMRFVKPIGGTYNCRNIAGSGLRSMHAYGAAIDINTEFGDYWRWSSVDNWGNQIPLQIVRIFERHGFIWGGYWYHFDTIHFEYRPELLPG